MTSTSSTATPRRAGFRIAVALAGVSLLALAGCNDAEAGKAADAVVNGDAGMVVAQADTSAATPAGDAAAAPSAEQPAAAASSIAVVDAPPSSGSVPVADLMAKQALPDVVIGDPDAPVTIVEYASMTCPHCADFHSETLPAIKKEFIDTGKAKLILREFPFDPRALAAFMLARCTGDDSKRTAMVDVLFDQQADWARAENASEALLRIAKLAGMSQDEFTACLDNKELQQQVVDVQQLAQTKFEVSATPTFFVNGDKYAGALGAPEMAAVIRAHE